MSSRWVGRRTSLQYKAWMLTTCGRVLREGLDAVFPTVERDGMIAMEISRWTANQVGDYCPRCGEGVTPAGFDEKGCPQCRGLRLNWSRVFRLGRYDEPLEDWIHAMKFGGRWAWSDAFGTQLAHAVEADASWCEKYLNGESDHATMVCPVPMHRRRRWSRGYNQAQRMAAAFAKYHGLACLDLLKRHRATPPQTAIHPNDREANVRHAFSLASKRLKLEGLRVVLVDDVKTSGGTLRACVRILRDAGVSEVTCVVAAVADHHPNIEVL